MCVQGEIANVARTIGCEAGDRARAQSPTLYGYGSHLGDPVGGQQLQVSVAEQLGAGRRGGPNVDVGVPGEPPHYVCAVSAFDYGHTHLALGRDDQPFQSLAIKVTTLGEDDANI